MITIALLLLMTQASSSNLDNDLPDCEGYPAACVAAEAAADEADERAEPDECYDPQAQQVMNICAAREYESADAALNAQWALTAAAIKEADAGIDREYDRQPDHFETLLEGQRAWLKFRDAQCLLESFEGRGGSMQPMLDSFCKTRMTEQRTEQLRSLSSEPEY